MEDGSFWALLQEVTHNGFTAGTALMTALTLLILIVAVRRILPKHQRDDTLPAARRTRR